MRKSFAQLDQEKQDQIVQAAMMVFAQNPYKHANTEEIAYHAGISKGLLFYYFKNKQRLFLYLCEYCEQVLLDYLDQIHFEEPSDFFAIMNEGAKAKIALIQRYPYMMEFVMKAWYGKDMPEHANIVERFQVKSIETFQRYFKHLDTSKFKDGVDYMYAYRMLVWMSEGYLYELQSRNQCLDIDAMMEEFHRWEAIFKTMIYKEEFQ